MMKIMLESLLIKNFVLIDELAIDFQAGLTIFTGETGAGKSIVIDAISLLTGEKFTTSYQKLADHDCMIEGVFTCSNVQLIKALEEAGINVEDNLVISRTLTSSGRLKNYVNNRSVSASFLKTLFDGLIDIHSQHQSQYLLNKAYHLQLVDKFLQDNSLLVEVKSLFQTYQSLVKAKEKLINDLASQDIDFIQFQYDEIAKLNFDLETYLANKIQLSELEAKLNGVKFYQETLDYLTNLDLDSLYKAIKSSSKINDELSNRLNEAYYQLDDIQSELIKDLSFISDEERTLNLLQNEMQTINRVLKKYQYEPELMLEKFDEYSQLIENSLQSEYLLSKYDLQISEAYQAYLVKAKLLSSKRQEAAKELEALILKQLYDLSLPQAKLEFNFNNEVETSNGIDSVEIYVSLNKNQSLQPLKKVASGGELSRLMLGLKVVFNSVKASELMIFDEIDSGVSGQVAFEIGSKFKEIAQSVQVFAITHLASVAAYADVHFKVSKEHLEDKSVSKVTQLSGEAQVNELAILANNLTSDSSIASARELLALARQK